MVTYTAYAYCPSCRRQPESSLFSNFFSVYRCRECGTKYCKECGNRSCPNCGSLRKFEVGKAYA